MVDVYVVKGFISFSETISAGMERILNIVQFKADVKIFPLNKVNSEKLQAANFNIDQAISELEQVHLKRISAVEVKSKSNRAL